MFAELIKLSFPISLALLVASLGMQCPPRAALSLFRQPALLVRSLLAMNVVMPLFTVWLVAVTDLKPAVKIALVALAASPVPPILPGKQLKLVTDATYVYGLLVGTSLLAIVIAPLTMTGVGFLFGRDFHVNPSAVAKAVALSILVPLACGIALRRFWPSFADQAGEVAQDAGFGLLILALLIVLAVSWRTLGTLLGDGTLLACIAFVIVGLAVGHVLGGRDPDNKTVLALAAATRHPGVAIALGASLFPDEKLVPAAVVLALLVAPIASAPYTAWRKRLHLHTRAHTP